MTVSYVRGTQGETRREEKQDLRTAVCLSLLLVLALFLLPAALERIKRIDQTSGESVRQTDQTETNPLSEAEQSSEAGQLSEKAEQLSEETEPLSETERPSAQAEPSPPQAETALSVSGEQDGERIIHVLLHGSGSVTEMDLGTYLTGVLRGEMPASFEVEALKAQAVAARTYTRYMLAGGGKHGKQADICTDSNCCQAYVSMDRARENWGEKADTYEKKIEDAVKETDGQILLYEDQPILAVFHSSSAGLTRTAEDVWSGGQPYLRPVSSPETADNVPNYYSRVEFRKAEFCAKVKKAYPKADFSTPAGEWIRDAVRDEAGSIVTLCVGGVTMQGSKLRGALGLRSACFTWEVQGDSVVFYVTGFGHGVGLSQYGANQMAADGADYREILTHYYTGVRIGGYPSA